MYYQIVPRIMHPRDGIRYKSVHLVEKVDEVTCRLLGSRYGRCSPLDTLSLRGAGRLVVLDIELLPLVVREVAQQLPTYIVDRVVVIRIPKACRTVAARGEHVFAIRRESHSALPLMPCEAPFFNAGPGVPG